MEGTRRMKGWKVRREKATWRRWKRKEYMNKERKERGLGIKGNAPKERRKAEEIQWRRNKRKQNETQIGKEKGGEGRKERG